MDLLRRARAVLAAAVEAIRNSGLTRADDTRPDMVAGSLCLSPRSGMSPSDAWRQRIGLPESPPESSRPADGRSWSRGRALADGLEPSSRRGTADVRVVGRRPGRGLAAALLCLLLLGGVAPDVAAQTSDDDTAVFYIHPVKSDGTPELDGQRVTVSEDDGKLVFRVQHARSPERENGVGHAIKFNYCVVDDRQSKPGWHVRSRCGGNTATLPANTAYVDVEVPVRANTEGPGGNNGARVILTAGTGYITLNTSAFYTIRDGTDTEPARQSHNVLIRSSDKNKEWTEGEKLSFEIRLNRPAQVPFDVHLKVSESGFGDFVAAAHEGHKTVRFKHGQTWYNYLVPTVKNAGSRQPQSVVTVTLTDTNGNARKRRAVTLVVA